MLDCCWVDGCRNEGGALAALGIRSGLSLRQVVACYPIKEKSVGSNKVGPTSINTVCPPSNSVSQKMRIMTLFPLFTPKG